MKFLNYLNIILEDLTPHFQGQVNKIFFNSKKDLENFKNFIYTFKNNSFFDSQPLDWIKLSGSPPNVANENFIACIEILNKIFDKNKDEESLKNFFNDIKKNHNSGPGERIVKALKPLIIYWINKNNILKNREALKKENNLK